MTKFNCWIEEYGQTEDDGLTIEVPDDRGYTDAACRFLEQYESKYRKHLMEADGSSLVVSVKQEDRPEIANIKVWLRLKPVYFVSVDWVNK